MELKTTGRKVIGFVDEYWRECTKCNKYKTWDKYYTLPWGKWGRASSCKDCLLNIRKSQSTNSRVISRYKQEEKIGKEGLKAYIEDYNHYQNKERREEYDLIYNNDPNTQLNFKVFERLKIKKSFYEKVIDKIDFFMNIWVSLEELQSVYLFNIRSYCLKLKNNRDHLKDNL